MFSLYSVFFRKYQVCGACLFRENSIISPSSQNRNCGNSAPEQPSNRWAIGMFPLFPFFFLVDGLIFVLNQNLQMAMEAFIVTWFPHSFQQSTPRSHAGPQASTVEIYHSKPRRIVLKKRSYSQATGILAAVNQSRPFFAQRKTMARSPRLPPGRAAPLCFLP